MRPLEQLHTTPFYRLERTDQYVLVGYGHNTSDTGQAIKWKAHRTQDRTRLQVFNRLTTVEVETPWPINVASDDRAIKFSAHLDKDFTHTETSSGGWSNSSPFDVIAMVAKKKCVAVYQMQSYYELLREDGTPVTFRIEYTDDESLHLTEYPPEADCAALPHAQPATDSSADEPAPETAIDTRPKPMTEPPIATDTAP